MSISPSQHHRAPHAAPGRALLQHATSAIDILPRSLIPANSSRCHYFGTLAIQSAEHDTLSALERTLTNLGSWLKRYLPPNLRSSVDLITQGDNTPLYWGDTHLSAMRHRHERADGTASDITAFALEHTDRASSGRRWRTEIVLHQRNHSEIRAHISLYYGTRLDYVGPEPETPTPSTPGVVRSIIQDKHLKSCHNKVRVFERPLSVDDTPASARFFCELLVKRERTAPIVLMNRKAIPGEKPFCWDPYALAAGVIGSGTIVVPTTPLLRDGSFLSTVREILGERYIAGIADGGVRVFQPGLNPSRHSDPLNHRYFHGSAGPEVSTWIKDALIRTLRNGLDSRKEVSTFEQVRFQIEKAREFSRWEDFQVRIRAATSTSTTGSPGGTELIQLEFGRALLDGTEAQPSLPPLPENPTAAEEKANLQQLVIVLEEKVNALRAENERLLELEPQHAKLTENFTAAEQLLDTTYSQLSDLEGVLEAERHARFTAESNLAAVQSILDGKQQTDAARKQLGLPPTLPKTGPEVVSFLQNELQPRVVILDNAIKTADDIPGSRVEDTWRFLIALHEELWPLHFGIGQGSSPAMKTHLIPAQFTATTGIDYSVKESSGTNKRADLISQRHAVIDGVEYDFCPHLKIGIKAKDALRIHFAVDEVNRRILVWHCGGHLDTAGTQRRNF